MSAGLIVPERVGIIMVHGIGEQRRFQHLDSQTRFLLEAMRSMTGKSGEIQKVTVDIAGTGAAAFGAERDTWTSGPMASATITVDHTFGGQPAQTQLLIHEVWWADANEPYSLAKQFRFWLWGLSLWALPERPNAGHLGTASQVAAPVVPAHSAAWDRIRLFLVGVFFALLGFSIGLFTFLATRLFNWHPPDTLRTLTNYISGVKLYNQQQRYGPGLIWGHEDFLDTVGGPPRVSARRRMIRSIADVACNRYNRWYVLAHSLGTVVAFNGLMETAYSWPGYLDENRWKRLKRLRMAGPMRLNVPTPTEKSMPPRPAWAGKREIAYRSRIFSRFRGFLTYGSPLEKFAGLWPALVPISQEPAFHPDARWFNVYDPVDPVSGRLLAFQNPVPGCCPKAEDVGYAASWWLLLAHLKYLTLRKPYQDVASRTVRWMLADSRDDLRPAGTRNGWKPGSWFTAQKEGAARGRSWLAWFTWLAAALVLALLGAVVMPIVWDAGVAVWLALQTKVSALTIGPIS